MRFPFDLFICCSDNLCAVCSSYLCFYAKRLAALYFHLSYVQFSALPLKSFANSCLRLSFSTIHRSSSAFSSQIKVVFIFCSDHLCAEILRLSFSTIQRSSSAFSSQIKIVNAQVVYILLLGATSHPSHTVIRWPYCHSQSHLAALRNIPPCLR